MKYVDTAVTFAEIPDQICLCINISGCQFRCPDCHSKYLWEDTGTELTPEVLDQLIVNNPGISCICLMGGTEEEILHLLKSSKKIWNLKRAWYTGQSEIPNNYALLMLLDYIKVGPYIAEKGPLTSETTNQRLYKIEHMYTPFGTDLGSCAIPVDITSRFWIKEEL